MRVAINAKFVVSIFFFYHYFLNFSGTVQSNIRPRRTMVPQLEVKRSSTLKIDPTVDIKKSQDISLNKGQLEKEESLAHRKCTTSIIGEGQEDASITPPSVSGTCKNAFDGGCNPFNAQECHPNVMTNCKDKIIMPPSQVKSQNVDGKKKVQFSVGNNATSQGNVLCFP